MTAGMHMLQGAARNGQGMIGMAGAASLVASPWFVRPRSKPEAPLRLFCFSHAGGAASAYFPWAASLPDIDVVSIQLPGREGRLGEPVIDDARQMTSRLTDAIGPLLDRPFVFFGHSMGSYLAFETTRSLRRAGLPLPSRLVLSGRRAPTEVERESSLHMLPDAALVSELNRRFGGLPAVILAEPELMAMYLPIIRGDLRLLERAEHYDEPLLEMPFSVFGGVEDARANETMLASWAALTASTCDVQMFPGGHFYLHEQRDNFLPALKALLAAEMSALSRLQVEAF